MSFAQLKANRAAQLAKMQEQIEKMNTGAVYFKPDENRWSPTLDKAGNATVVLRFLPAPEGEEEEYVKEVAYSFTGPSGLKYYAESPTTIGGKDPVKELNDRLWATKKKEDEEQARNQRRLLNFYSNVMIIKNSNKPEDEGKVFVWRYPRTIFKMLEKVMAPPEDEEEAKLFVPINPFDLWEGANFRLKIKQKGGFWNYDDSKFDPAGPLSTDDKQMEAIWKQCHSLQAYLDPSRFKSYDDLKARLQKVLTGEAPEKENTSTANQNAQNTTRPEVSEEKSDNLDQLLAKLAG